MPQPTKDAIVTEPAAPPAAKAAPARLPWIIALAMSVVANGVLATQNRTLDLQKTVAQKESKHYKTAYQGLYDKEIRLMQDFTTLYVANVTQLQQSGAAGDRQKALDSLDAANFFAGFLSRHSQDGQHLSSALYAAKLAAGKLGPADQEALKAATQYAQSRLDQVGAQLTGLRDQEPGASPEPGMPAMPPIPAAK
jgi:hypothetical protein